MFDLQFTEQMKIMDNGMQNPLSNTFSSLSADEKTLWDTFVKNRVYEALSLPDYFYFDALFEGKCKETCYAGLPVSRGDRNRFLQMFSSLQQLCLLAGLDSGREDRVTQQSTADSQTGQYCYPGDRDRKNPEFPDDLPESGQDSRSPDYGKENSGNEISDMLDWLAESSAVLPPHEDK